MTQQTEPTDAEIIAALRPLYASATAAEMGSADDLVTARAVLAKWGRAAPQPAPEAQGYGIAAAAPSGKEAGK